MNIKLLIAVGVILFSGTLYAQTPDEQTPANEGICDDLMFATPGLFGLCIAFCEAQDCEPDFALDDPFESCRPSSEKLLANYRKKMHSYDLDMPCIAPSPSCPCWTEEELDNLRFAGDIEQCGKDRIPGNGFNFDFWQIFDTSQTFATAVATWEILENEGPICALTDVCDDGQCLQVRRFQTITADEFVVCESELALSGLERGFDCFE